MIEDLLKLLDYGVVAVALYMMYDIANNHLSGMEATLIRIEELLKKG